MDKNIIVKNYKCFVDETIIEKPSLVNLIIGRNNCGKTSLTEVVEYVHSNQNFDKKFGSVKVETILTDNIIKSVFSIGTTRYSGTSYGHNDQYWYGKQLIGKSVFVDAKNTTGQLQIANIDFEQSTIKEKNDKIHYSKNDWLNLLILCQNSIKKRHFYKISAERDIVEEDGPYREIDSNGNGATSVINALLNEEGYDYSLVSKELLDDLNLILKGESCYSSIVVIKNSGSSKKSICLFENGKRIKLADMGSGLKTILLVLLVLKIHQSNIEDSAFIFEELENNLHPEIQRRLFNYIYDYCISHNCYAFITSHSHVAINCFYSKDNASIYHVYKKENGSSTVEKIESFMEKASLLDDLGVKASDIFQTNGIIWVEGPSDRIYINKWISLIDPSIKENVHYSFLYYGGKLLSHYTASDTDIDNLIRVMLINRNAAIVVDSDIDSEGEQIRDAKQRVIREFENNRMFAWVTKGREIENYIHFKDLNTLYGKDKYTEVPRFVRFSDIIKDDCNNFASQKVLFAKTIEMDENSLDVLDLREKIKLLIESIKKWNKSNWLK